MDITTLHQSPYLVPATLAMVEKAFDYAPPYQFATDFYPLAKESNHSNLHVIIENNRPITHIGILPKILNFDKQSFPVALLGGIATAQEKRGQGHFDKLITAVLAQYSSQMGYFLWGGEESLYKKYGFHQVGVIREKKGTSFTVPPHYNQTPYRELSSQNKQQLRNIYKLNTKHFVCLERDWKDIENITSCHLYVRENHQSQITDYFFINKGKDLSGIAHEVFTLSNHNFTCWLPDTPQHDHLPMLYGCLFKIGHPELFKKFIALYSRGSVILETITPDHIDFLFQNSILRLSVADFLSGIFGPGHIQEFKPFYSPLWFGGLDSI